VFYGGGITEASTLAGQQVYVVGAGNSAGQAAIHLAKYADRVTMVVRGGGVATSMSDYLVKTIQATQNIEVHLRTTVIGAHGAERLEELVLHDVASGRTRTVPAAALFVLIGAQPHTDWLPARISPMTRDSSSPDRTYDRSIFRSRQAWPVSSPSATCDTAQSNGWPPPSEKAVSASCRYISTPHCQDDLLGRVAALTSPVILED